MIYIPRVKTVSCQPSPGRASKGRLLIRGEDGGSFYAKPWHHDCKTINFHNQLRPLVATEVARLLGFQELAKIAILEDTEVAGIEILGTEVVNPCDDLTEDNEDRLNSIRNRADIPRIVFLDILLLNSDRKRTNSNLILSGNRLLMVDLDNFFAGAGRYPEAKEKHADYLARHPLAPWKAGAGCDLEETIRDAAQRTCAITDSWLSQLASVIPCRWFAEGGGAEVLGMLRTAKADANEVALLLRAPAESRRS